MKQMSFDFHSRRSMVTARNGMVAASNPLAAQAGLQTLREGGNAADAAVTAAAVLNVTEAASTGMGGDCFALYFDAKSGAVTALNGSGRAPAALTADMLRARGWTTIPDRSADAISVPGAVAGWEDLIQRHGRMTLARVLRDAITYARDGFPVQPVYGASWGRSEAFLRGCRYAGDYLPGGRAPVVGQLVRLPDLARTLQTVAEGGAEAFYQGHIADAIVETVQEHGGVLALEDLHTHHSTWDEPIRANYRGVTVIECPPNGQGLAALQALRLIEGFDLTALPWDSAERLHILIESMRLGFADARYFIADDATNPAPVHELLSDPYIRQRRALIQRDRAMQPPSFGHPFAGSDTVYLTAVDGEGNACSFINSLYMGFGTGICTKGTGVFLQNRGALFSLEEGHPNELAPGKRPYHTIIPGMALKDGALWASFGVMGGFMQPQGHVQVISAMVDDSLNPQEAVNRPRWLLADGTADSPLHVEEGIPVRVMSALAEMGHPVRPVSGQARGIFGDGQIIRRDAETGVLFGGSDPRKDGLVAAW
ncbi:MAG: gamma-glutamyltransferase [Anaerolineae bacterium]